MVPIADLPSTEMWRGRFPTAIVLKNDESSNLQGLEYEEIHVVGMTRVGCCLRTCAPRLDVITSTYHDPILRPPRISHSIHTQSVPNLEQTLEHLLH